MTRKSEVRDIVANSTAGSSVRSPVAIDRGSDTARWRALGTYVHLQVTEPELLRSAVDLAQATLDEVDRSCSRFRTDSDLTRANLGAGTWIAVSPVLIGAVRVAVEAAEQTDGLVNPTVGEVIRAGGYDRSFELIAPSAEPTGLPQLDRRVTDAWRELAVHDDAICVPPGSRLDLGATGKAYAADLVATRIARSLGLDLIISVGGDIRVAGPQAEAGVRHWPVSIAARYDELDDDPRQVDVGSGGLATSSVAARAWVQSGRSWHHIVDPRTSAPARSPWRSVTAAGHTCVAANVASTCGIILAEEAPAWLQQHGVSALLIGHDGLQVTTGDWPTELD